MTAPSLDVNEADRKFLNDTDLQNWIMPYKILHKKSIGEGSYGRVYRVVIGDDSNTILVQKVSKNTKNQVPDDYIREVGILKMLALSTNRTGVDRLIRLVGLSLIKDDDNRQTTSIFTPFYEYGNLSTFLRQNGSTLTVTVMRQMCMDVLTMIEQLHAHQIIHRDFKSGNIVVSQSMRLVLIDFGQSVLVGHRYYLTGRRVTTMHVRAPEIICGSRGYNYSVDIHSCACILWEIFLGGVKMLPNLCSSKLNKIGNKDTYMMHQLYYLLGSKVRKFKINREFASIHSLTYKAVKSFPTRRRHVQKVFYRRYNRRLKLRKVAPLRKYELIQACLMINSMLFWFPFERLKITRKTRWRQKIAFLQTNSRHLSKLEDEETTTNTVQLSMPMMDIMDVRLQKPKLHKTTVQRNTLSKKRRFCRGGKKIKRRKLNINHKIAIQLAKKKSNNSIIYYH